MLDNAALHCPLELLYVLRTFFRRTASGQHPVPAPGSWSTVLDCLCDHFSTISREQWLSRIVRGRVLDGQGLPISVDLAYREGLRIHYFREVPDEKVIPVQESILYVDEHLVVADKPHFLPVTPAGNMSSKPCCAA